MKKFAHPTGSIDDFSGTIKNVMMQGMSYVSDGEITVGYLGEEGDVCHSCACKHFLPRQVEHYVSYSSMELLLADIRASKISYGLVSLGRTDKGSNFSVLDKILESQCYIKSEILFPLDSLRLYSRRSDEKSVHTVYIPLSLTEADWTPRDKSINVCYTPSLYAAISTSSQRLGTVLLSHPFAADTFRLHESFTIEAQHSTSALRHVVIGRTMPIITENRQIIFRKEVNSGNNIFDVLGKLESKGFDVCRVETQCLASSTRLYVTGRMSQEFDNDAEFLAALDIARTEFIGLL